MLTSCDSQGDMVRLQPCALPTAAPAMVPLTELLGFAQTPFSRQQMLFWGANLQQLSAPTVQATGARAQKYLPSVLDINPTNTCLLFPSRTM